MRAAMVQARRIWPALFLMLLEGALPLAAKAPASAVPANPDDKTIVHVLNRIGFGPRPGDVERVRALGLRRYIDEQLQPDRLRDEAISGRLAPLETLNLSSREIVR